jgi:hypothetical protein
MRATLTETMVAIKLDAVKNWGWPLLSQLAQTMTTTIVVIRAAISDTITRRKISFCNVVRPGVFSEVSCAILPKTVASPVNTAIPSPVPEVQEVPWRAIFLLYIQREMQKDYF